MTIHTNGTLNGLSAPALSPSAKRRAARRWILIPLGLIITQMSIVITMMCIATSDPTFAVEPNYYEKALAWDATAAQNHTNQRLAWRTEMAASASSSGKGEFAVRLTNSDSTPLDGAKVRAELFANTNARARTILDLVANGDGRYGAPTAFDRLGMWECRLVVTRGPETFTTSAQFEVRAAPEGSP